MDSNSIINGEEKTTEIKQTSTETHTEPEVKSSRTAATNALAIVGFLALIFIGIGLAIYSSQFVPMAVTKLTSRTATTTPAVGVVTTTYIPFPASNSVATTTTIAENVTTPAATTTPSYSTAPAPSDYSSSYSSSPSYAAPTYPATAGAAHALYGLPDLATNIVATGYLANGPGSAFVASPVVPVGAVAAIQFTIANVGTNATGPWGFIAQIPTDNGYTYTSPTEENMNPGDHILFTLSFDQVPPGQDELVRVVADPNDQIPEINKANNVANGTLTVVGS